MQLSNCGHDKSQQRHIVKYENISEKRSLIDTYFNLVPIYIKTLYNPITQTIIERDQIQSVIFYRIFLRLALDTQLSNEVPILPAENILYFSELL